MKVYIKLDKSSYLKIKNFLLSDGNEHAVFMLAKTLNTGKTITFEVQNYYLVPLEETENSSFDLSLTDVAQSKILKWAWDNNASLIEIHSHPFSNKNVRFSSYDIEGFKEFVPHLWWRLKEKPYIAMVQGSKDYDALVWIDSPENPQKLDGLLLDNTHLLPTNRSINYA